jgi:3-oxoadipate enol-lactonase
MAKRQSGRVTRGHAGGERTDGTRNSAGRARLVGQRVVASLHMASSSFSLPAGRLVTIPDRGDMWIWDSPGPPGAPTVVLLHGWMSTAALNWCPAFEELSTRFRVIAPDHRGHGRGLHSNAAFRLEDCADDVAALIEALDVGSATAVGYSMGGPIAYYLLRRHPELVDGLVLCATAARFAGRPELSGVVQVVGRGVAWALGRIPQSLVRQGASRLAHPLGQKRDGSPDPWVVIEAEGGSPAAFVQAAAALNGLDARSWMPEIDVPTAVVVTTEDHTVSPDRQRWLAEAIPGATTYEVHGDHRACIDDAAEFVPTLLAACKQVAGLNDAVPIALGPATSTARAGTGNGAAKTGETATGNGAAESGRTRSASGRPKTPRAAAG